MHSTKLVGWRHTLKWHGRSQRTNTDVACLGRKKKIKNKKPPMERRRRKKKRKFHFGKTWQHFFPAGPSFKKATVYKPHMIGTSVRSKKGSYKFRKVQNFANFVIFSETRPQGRSLSLSPSFHVSCQRVIFVPIDIITADTTTPFPHKSSNRSSHNVMMTPFFLPPSAPTISHNET